MSGHRPRVHFGDLIWLGSMALAGEFWAMRHLGWIGHWAVYVYVPLWLWAVVYGLSEGTPPWRRRV